MSSPLKILISPLNWGMGHATRCAPIIRCLQKRGVEVVIGAEERALAFLRSTFPDLEYHSLPGYSISYPEKGSMMLKMAASVPGIIRGIKAEHESSSRLVEKLDIHGVISDNRFGLWHPRVPTVFITHQVSIKLPFGENILFQANRNYIRKFNFCWIPDFENEPSLSGDLAHQRKLPLTTTYIGPLSRFSKAVSKKGEGLLILLSGPEPQRTILEDKILEQLVSCREKIKGQIYLVRGMPGEKQCREFPDYIRVYSHADDETLMKLVSDSSLIICRSGYSTLMDLYFLGGKAVFIPTPGQTEQEYLGERMMEQNTGMCMKQNKLDLAYAISGSDAYKGFKGESGSYEKLEKAVDDFLKFIRN